MMRSARTKVHVIFTDYLRTRRNGVPTLVFEGQQCPAYYISKIRSIAGSVPLRQLIARGKRNVLELRNLIQRNSTTKQDKTLYFIDRDYDQSPEPGQFTDIYVTRGYSIENEVFEWSVIDAFIRSHFDIATSEDEDAIAETREIFENAKLNYINSTRFIQKTIFICRRKGFRITLGEDISEYFSLNWSNLSTTPRTADNSELMIQLAVEQEHHSLILELIEETCEFDDLDESMRWRGKYHFSFLRSFLTDLTSKRRRGEHPFTRASRVGIEPSHPSLFANLSINAITPACLENFVGQIGFKGGA